MGDDEANGADPNDLANDPLRAIVPDAQTGNRLDRALVALFPDYSRSQLQRAIQGGAVLVDGAAAKPRQSIVGGQAVTFQPPLAPEVVWAPQALPVNYVHVDPDLIVVDKRAGLVVHPGAGNPDLTLANALLHDFPELERVPRAGLVHRLDKDTSGLLVVARTRRAHTALTSALKARTVGRLYQAVVHGRVDRRSEISAPIGRHPADRKRMCVRDSGRPATTGYRPLARFSRHTHLELRLKTGRTHQIRVHLEYLGHPLCGDPVYRRGRHDGPLDRELGRQALHAVRLTLHHPADARVLSFESPLPADLQRILSHLESEDEARTS